MEEKEFLQAVEHELRTLKDIATKEELSSLSLYGFNPTVYDSCIYGQMTGSCYSVRAKELMDKACVVTTQPIEIDGEIKGGIYEFRGQTFSKVKPFINGKNNGQGWRDEGGSWLHSRSYNHLSALEAYICMDARKIEHIISFLRDESKELTL